MNIDKHIGVLYTTYGTKFNTTSGMFYAELLVNHIKTIFTKKWNSITIETAMITIKNDKIIMIINPDFWATLSFNHQLGLLLHECLHLIHMHFLRASKSKIHKLWNIALDAAINQYIISELLPIGAILPNTIDKNAKLNECGEYYYNLLKNNINNCLNTIDQHDWELCEVNCESNQNLVEYNKKFIESTIISAALETKGAGKELPLEVLALTQNIENSKINWKQQLKQFIHSTLKANKTKSRKRINRRYGTIYAGHKKDRKLHLCCALDVSGSVQDSSIQNYFLELNNIIKSLPIKLTIMDADTEINQIYEYKLGQKIEVKGRGGTAYQPAFDKAKELKVDGLIYFGDMDCADTPQRPKFPVLWAVVQNGTPPVPWGKQIKI